MKPLTGLDGAFLDLETPATPMHVGSLHLFDPPPGYRRDFYAEVKRMLADRMHLAPVFRRRVATMPFGFANPVWVEDADVDLDVHVRRIRLPAPGTQAQLEACTAALHAELMDRSRPLWMLYILEGLATCQIGYYIKIHHAVLDGAAGVALAGALFDVSARAARVPPAGRPVRAKGERPGALALAAAAFRHDAAQYVKLVRHLPDVVRTLAGMVRNSGGKGQGDRLRRNFSFGPRTPLNVTITPERGFAAVSIPLDEVRAVAKSRDATVNDVVLSLCSGMLRRYLARHGGIPRKPLTATMPISLREPGNTEFATQATLSLVSLATNVADPLRRLSAVRDAAAATKSLARRARPVIPTDFPSIGVPWILGALASAYGKTHLADAIPPIANVVISNVPGPPVPLYAAGARMSAYWPLSIVEHGVGLNITVMSYAGALGFGFTVARCAVPDARELATDLTASWDELKQRATKWGVQPTRTVGAAPAESVRRAPAKPRKSAPTKTRRAAPRARAGTT